MTSRKYVFEWGDNDGSILYWLGGFENGPHIYDQRTNPLGFKSHEEYAESIEAQIDSELNGLRDRVYGDVITTLVRIDKIRTS